MAFTAQKLEWIERVVRDHTLPPLARCVAALIGLHYLNRTSGDAWPSQSKLAADLGVSRRAIQYALDAIVDAGHLTREGSLGRVNHYRPVLEVKNVQDAEPEGAQPTAQVLPPPAQPTAQVPAQIHSHMNPLKEIPLKEKNPLKNIYLPDNHSSEAAKGTFQAENKPMAENNQADVFVAATPIPQGSAVPPSPTAKKEKRPMSISVEDYSSFEIWWQEYPKKVARFDAAKAYGKVLKSGLATTEVLLEAAKRYAAERAGQDPKFTKHPTTWLNGGCWMDEPLKPLSQPSRMSAAAAGMRGFLEEGYHRGGK
jgi:hypothetical protein